MSDICETSRVPTWHILELKNRKFRVYSSGFRTYGTFNTIDDARNYIVNKFPNKRYPIIVQNNDGMPILTLHFDEKPITSPLLQED